MCNMHAYHKMNQCQRVTVRAGVSVESCVCVSDFMRMCITCSYMCGHWCWGLVHIHELKYTCGCVYTSLLIAAPAVLSPHTTELVYMYLFMTSAAPTQLKLMVYNTKRTGTHYIYRKVYREINGQKSIMRAKLYFIQTLITSNSALRSTLVPYFTFSSSTWPVPVPTQLQPLI